MGAAQTKGVLPTTSEKNSSAVPLSIFLAVALLSAAVLGFEVALSRVFAVVLRYQFAFLVVSLALCGLGLGGLWANLRPRTSLENAALGWGLAVPVALGLILRGVFAHTPQNYWIAALVVLVPFGFAGAFLSLAFGRFQAQGGRLYAYDLAGAALAAAGSVLLMQWVGALHAALLFGALGALAGVLTSQKRAFPLLICGFLLALVPFDSRFGLFAVPPIPPVYPVSTAQRQEQVLAWAKAQESRRFDRNFLPDSNSLADRGVTQPLFTEIGAQNEAAPLLDALQKAGQASAKLSLPRTRILDTRWNAFARTDVVADPDAGPDSWLIYTNGNVPTNMLHWGGKEWQLPALTEQFPISEWTYANANLGGADVFSIGPGGGLDALLALRYGARHFEGAEINPSIVGLMNEPHYVAWNGGIYQNPKVHVRTAEGRDALRESKGKYRLVFSALTKTATAGQGAALLESFIYTREAFNDYQNALDDGGSLAIVGDALPLLGRLTATAVDHFKRMGQSERDAGQHIAVVFDPQRRGPYGWVLMVKKTPFTPAQTTQMAASASAHKLFPLWIPGRAQSDEGYPFGSTLSGALSLDAFVKAGLQTTPEQPLALDLSPCPDDRPFVLDLGTSPVSLFEASPSLSGMLGASLLATLGLAAFLTFSGKRDERDAMQNARSTGLFLLLGIGFMLVEVPLIQKLVLPLGYPTLSLTVILFSVLLGGGAGALFSQRFEGDRLRRHALMCAVGVAIWTLVFAVSSDAASRALLGLPITLRCIAAVLLLLPLGFLLGTPFPSGMRLFGRGERGVVLAWALNGTASVLGSIGAAVLAKMFGFSVVLSLGALLYVGVAVLLSLKTPQRASGVVVPKASI